MISHLSLSYYIKVQDGIIKVVVTVCFNIVLKNNVLLHRDNIISEYIL